MYRHSAPAWAWFLANAAGRGLGFGEGRCGVPRVPLYVRVCLWIVGRASGLGYCVRTSSDARCTTGKRTPKKAECMHMSLCFLFHVLWITPSCPEFIGTCLFVVGIHNLAYVWDTHTQQSSTSTGHFHVRRGVVSFVSA